LVKIALPVVLGKLFTPVVPLFTKLQTWQQPSQGLRG